MRTLTLFLLLFLSGCGHYNYGVKRDSSPVPYKNLYDGDDHEQYEFHSTLFKFDNNRKYSDYVEITHLNDVYNFHESTPEKTWRSSNLNFNIGEKLGIEVLTSTVKLQHFYESGELIKPSEVLSTISSCENTKGCNAFLMLRYNDELPERITERVSFTLVINGKEKHINYTIPLEYKYHYSFWDVMMGV